MCHGRQEESDSKRQILRYVALNGKPVFRFDRAELQPAGDCAVLSDRLDTSELAAGSYTYHLRWESATKGHWANRTVEFQIASPEP